MTNSHRSASALFCTPRRRCLVTCSRAKLATANAHCECGCQNVDGGVTRLRRRPGTVDAGGEGLDGAPSGWLVGAPDHLRQALKTSPARASAPEWECLMFFLGIQPDAEFRRIEGFHRSGRFRHHLGRWYFLRNPVTRLFCSP